MMMRATLLCGFLAFGLVAAPAAAAVEAEGLTHALDPALAFGAGPLALGIDPFLLAGGAPLDLATLLSILAWMNSIAAVHTLAAAVPVDAVAVADATSQPASDDGLPKLPGGDDSALYIQHSLPLPRDPEAAAGPERPTAQAPVPRPTQLSIREMPPAATVAVLAGGATVGFALLAWLRPSWLRWLVPLPLLTYTREALLENPMRARLLQAVEANPGVHFNQLVKDLGLGRGQAEHHLRALEKARLVTRHVAGGYACYFADPAAARDLKGVVNVLKAEPARRALQHVLDHPGTRPFDVARSQGMSPDSALYHLRQLAQAELVCVVIAGEKRLLFPTPAAQRALAALRVAPHVVEAPLVAA